MEGQSFYFFWMMNLVILCLETIFQVKGFGFGEIFKDQVIKLRPRSIEVDPEGVKVSHVDVKLQHNFRNIKQDHPLMFIFKTDVYTSFLQTNAPNFHISDALMVFFETQLLPFLS